MPESDIRAQLAEAKQKNANLLAYLAIAGAIIWALICYLGSPNR